MKDQRQKTIQRVKQYMEVSGYVVVSTPFDGLGAGLNVQCIVSSPEKPGSCKEDSSPLQEAPPEKEDPPEALFPTPSFPAECRSPAHQKHVRQEAGPRGQQGWL